MDQDREIRLVRQGQAVPAQGTMAPAVYGNDANFRSEMSQHDLARAKALLDTSTAGPTRRLARAARRPAADADPWRRRAMRSAAN